MPSFSFAFGPHASLYLFQEMLLRTDDATRPADSHPGYRFGRSETIVFHEVGPDARPRAAQSCFAMDREGIFATLKSFQYLVEYLHRWTRAVKEKGINVADTRIDEVLLVVTSFVQPNNHTNVFALEIRNIITWCQRTIAFWRYMALKGRPSKSKDFIFDNPIQVTILCTRVLMISTLS